MIEYIKENSQWLGAVVVPIVVALIGVIAVLVRKAGRKQKVGDIHGDGNQVINGDKK